MDSNIFYSWNVGDQEKKKTTTKNHIISSAEIKLKLSPNILSASCNVSNVLVLFMNAEWLRLPGQIFGCRDFLSPI